MKITKRAEEIIQLAKDMGLDFFPVIFETIEASTMHNLCSYGLPTRARHWSYGRSYDHQKTYGEMGYSKVYEIILNNNPSYAFMLDSNTEVQNLFIVAHCLGHSAFFKNNCMFQSSDRNMISHAAEHAGRVENYIEKHGFEKVERIMDIGFALDDHIDWNKGVYRNRNYKNVKKSTSEFKSEEFDDLLTRKNIIKKEELKEQGERDLLWFLINKAPLEDWERDVLDIIREEAYYFYPQKMSKIINEGFASYWHAEIMYQYKGLTSTEYLDFLRDHEKVVQPGRNPFQINPYYLGFKIFKDIEERWDEQYGNGYGKAKIFEIAKNEDDISFLRNYLTANLVDELKLFTYGYVRDYGEDYEDIKYIEIKERVRDEVVETLVKPLYNGGVPKIVVEDVKSDGTLVMRHDSEEVGTLNRKYAAKTLEYVWDLWAAPIELHTFSDDNEEMVLCFDEAGFEEKYLKEEYDFGEEEVTLSIDASKKNWIVFP
jgi:stage V sporulation protein R